MPPGLLLGLISSVVFLSSLVSDREHAEALIAVAPIGGAPREEIEALLPALAESFRARVVVAPPVRLPSEAYDERRRQYLSTSILDSLAAAKKPEWDRLLGVADVDLYVPDLNFVFGEGDSRRGVAVFSMARLKSRNPVLLRRRVITEAVHELGHACGLSHCDDPHCVMWFSNTLAESDEKGTQFCRRHRRQLERASSRP